ncbi:MAG: hypothetical protein KatS3mg032_1460 [Cyclobacteriaceae bacterium]|nr:MAG: hypothetical protein KatS3mg032_1460 [Cyclobacteriaceae bacterium]
MNPRIEIPWQQLEQSRARLTDLLKDVPETHFTYAPVPGKWSLAQVLAHLITVEQLSLNYMKKKSQNLPQCKTAGFLSDIWVQLFFILQQLPLKFTAPGVVVQHTPPARSFSETQAWWQQVRNDMQAFLLSFPDEHIKKLIYKHPAGRFNVYQALVVLRAHLHHHLPQIKHLLKSFPVDAR